MSLSKQLNTVAELASAAQELLREGDTRIAQMALNKTQAVVFDIQTGSEMKRKKAAKEVLMPPGMLPQIPDTRALISGIIARAPLALTDECSPEKGKPVEMRTEADGYQIKYVGCAVTEYDITVFKGLLHLAKHVPVGTLVTVSRYQLWQHLGNATKPGPRAAERLDKALDWLSTITLSITGDGLRLLGIRLFASTIKVKDGKFTYAVTPEARELFAQGGWGNGPHCNAKSLVVRKLVDLAYSGMRGAFNYTTEGLATLCRYEGPGFKFRDKLRKATAELAEYGVRLVEREKNQWDLVRTDSKKSA